jgi:predicted nucleic acid-binding protein
MSAQKRKTSKAIVVDASVLRSAGLTENPSSIRCREVLETMRDYCHRAVVTEEIRAEWRTHASGFAVRWLAAMTARKKLEEISLVGDASDLPSQFDACLDVPAHRAAVAKDVHLLLAALEADRTIITRDHRLRQILNGAAVRVGQLHQIVFANPDVEAEEVTAWLNRGAPFEKKRCLGYEPRRDD